MKCKQCISNNIWIKFLPSELLKVCVNCETPGLQTTKVLKLGGFISIFIYIVALSLLII